MKAHCKLISDLYWNGILVLHPRSIGQFSYDLMENYNLFQSNKGPRSIQCNILTCFIIFHCPTRAKANTCTHSCMLTHGLCIKCWIILHKKPLGLYCNINKQVLHFVYAVKTCPHQAKANAEAKKIKEQSEEIKERTANIKENFRFRLVWTLLYVYLNMGSTGMLHRWL